MELDQTPEEIKASDTPSDMENEFLTEGQLQAILESLLFTSEKPLSLESLKSAFADTNIKVPQIKKALQDMSVELAGGHRGLMLEEVAGGYQLRTKIDQGKFIKRLMQNRPFRLSGPALEVLSIVAYKQPCIKSEIDEIRGVDSGHLVRALMDRGLVRFAGKSELPGKPMQYETTKKFLEVFGLRHIGELPTPSEIDELIPEGIGEPTTEEKTFNTLTDELSIKSPGSYSQSEGELFEISETLIQIQTTTDFFEQEKIKEKAHRNAERAQDIREALLVGETIDVGDLKWLEKYEIEMAGIIVPSTDSLQE